jgi:hypothetical protein
MPGCLDCETCFYCGRFLSPRHEHDHFPIPRRAGGTATVPACIDCHDLKDRFPVFAWPVHSLVPVFNGCESRPVFELLVALADSMPHVYRSRVPMDPLPVELRPLADWSTDELVETVLAANTTEARLYLSSPARGTGATTGNAIPSRPLLNAPGRIRTCDLRIRSPLLYPD